MPDCNVTVSGLSKWWLVNKCMASFHILSYEGFQTALDILMKEPSLNWMEDNQLYDYFKTWRKRIEMLTTGMHWRKSQDFMCHCIKGWSEETGQTHNESAGFTDDDIISTKHIMDGLEDHCKPRSSVIVGSTAYKQLVQGDLGLLEYTGNNSMQFQSSLWQMFS